MAGLVNCNEFKILGSSSGSISLKSGATPTAHDIVFPSTQGANKTVMVNNGSGVLADQTLNAFAQAVTGAVVFAGRLQTDDATDATSGTDGSLQTDGGLSVVKKAWIGTTLTVIGATTLKVLTVDSATITLTQDTNFVTSGGVNGMSIDGTTFSVDGTNNRVGFGTAAPSQKIEILESGNLQCLMTATLANTESATFRVLAGGRVGEIGSYKHSGITNPTPFMLLVGQGGANNWYWTDDINQFRISSTKDHIGTTSGTIVGTQTSDERLKANMQAISYGLATIKKLVPIQFDIDGVHKLGFGAQTTQPIIPEMVYDTNENIFDDEDNTKLAMDYSQVTPILVKAMQELDLRILQLEA